MKIINPYTTTIRTNHEQPLELKKVDSVETYNNKATDTPLIDHKSRHSKAILSVPKELQTIINTLKNKLPINSEVIQQLTEFVAKSEGTLDQKLETIKMLLNKNLELTMFHLKAIHQALQSKITVEEQIPGQFPSKNKDAEILSPLVKLNSNLITQMSKQLSANLLQGKSVEDGIQFVLQQLDQLSFLDQETQSRIKLAISEAINIKQENQLIHTDSDKQAQDYLLNKLQELFHQPETINSQQDNTKKNKIINPTHPEHQEFLNPIQLQSKDIIVNTITKRLAEATIQFKELKREIARNIDQVTTVASQTDKNVYQNIKSLVESAINKLDNAILKSDIIYLTDMKTEKILMQASSRLAEARVYLEDANQPKATEILREVKQTIDQLKWQPSDIKIKHFVAKESLFLEEPDLGNLSNKYGELVKSHAPLEGSARGMFELIRSQGLTYDSEMAQGLTSKNFDTQQEELQKNMKAVIMKLLETGTNEVKNPETRLAAENTLLNITGQQLLSKFDAHSAMQSMFFNLPTYLGEKLENIKVYVNSRKDGEKIDWENSSLYFLIETKKLGETGILVSSNNRNLSITIKNDHPAIQDKLRNIVSKYKDRIQAIGYQVSGIHFKKFNEKEATFTSEEISLEKKSIQPDLYHSSTEGYDFRI